MGSVGAPEILIVLVAALVILGPKRLPEAARQLGRALNEFRRVSNDLQAEVRDAFQEPVPPDPALTEPAALAGTSPPVVEGGEATPPEQS